MRFDPAIAHSDVANGGQLDSRWIGHMDAIKSMTGARW